MRTILITLDSLNRHLLELYGCGPDHPDHIRTPNLNHLADNGVVFDNHFTGSAPCMPARRELLTGVLELRHRGWGALEAFDYPLARRLRDIGCPSMLVTDHYHYFEHGGENFHCDFTGYELIRGHENDNWKTHHCPAPELNPHTQTGPNQERNRSTYVDESCYVAPKTFAAACEWVAENAATEEFFLYIDEFDPHEPFWAPERLLAEYDDSGYRGDRLEWPKYGRWQGTDRELRHLRNRYRAKVALLDELLGQLVERLRDHGMYDDTTIILTTDHGHFLGEHGWCGKPQCANYNTLFHIPMVVKPAASLQIETARRLGCLTTAADIFATICDLHGVDLNTATPDEPTTASALYGRSFLPVLQGSATRCRDYVLYGYYGKQLGYCDGIHTFLKSVAYESRPVRFCSSQSSQHPGFHHQLHATIRASDAITIGRFLHGVDYPVLSFLIPGDDPIVATQGRQGEDALFCLASDQGQHSPIHAPAMLTQYRQKLADAMRTERFPEETFARLGLAPPCAPAATGA